MLISWGLNLQEYNILEGERKRKKVCFTVMLWELRRDVNGKAGFHCSTQKCHISKGQKILHNLHGKKILVWNTWQKESVTIEVYNSITSGAAKVKEDLMLLACWIHTKTPADEMGAEVGVNYHSKIPTALLQEPTNSSLLCAFFPFTFTLNNLQQFHSQSIFHVALHMHEVLSIYALHQNYFRLL